MVRSPCIDKNGLKKGAWSEEEDKKLRAYVLRYGHWNWRQLPKFAGLSRSGQSCRLRWLNYLRPGVIRGNYTVEEEDLIIKLHEQFGNKWSAIARNLPGRSDNEIKNYWHTHLKKRMNQDPRSTEIMLQTSKHSGTMDDVDQIKQSAAGPVAYTEIFSSNCDSQLFSESNISMESIVEPFESFWTQPFALDASYNNDAHLLPPPDEEFIYPFSSIVHDGMGCFYE